jgi:ubiquinone/menaquinone biosynthesis C-methylase UbiE
MALRQRIVSSVISQFRRPTGLLGRLAGWEMALRSSNRKRNAWAVSLLDVRPTDRVLEIGFGPGLAIRELARRATRGHVAGVDHSAVMVDQASRRNTDAVRSGRVSLHVGSAESLPPFEEPFDKILSVNSVMFWDDPVERLREMRRLLRAGGEIAIVRQPRGPGSSSATKESVGAELRDLLAAAGFSDVRWDSLELQPPVVMARGVCPGI